MELNTFSIAARCPRTGELGVAVATAVPAVGAICPYVVAGVGAVSTQSWVNPYLAIGVLARLREGAGAEDALAMALAPDEARELRQVGVVDASGRAAAFTGERCTSHAGQRTGANVAIQGNMLTGPEVLDAMADTFASSEGEDLGERLMRVLEAGDAVGGDKRGKQSAALKVFAAEDYALLDLRVDEHAEPVSELRRVFTIAHHQLAPFVAGMPRRGVAAEGAPEEVTTMLLRPPPQRPGGGGSGPRTAS